MQFDLRQSLRMIVATLLVALFIVPTDALAQSHVVSPADLQKEAVAASQARQHNIDSVQRLLSTPAAEKALKSAKIDTQQVKTAVSTLDDQELAQLAARANKAQADFSAGTLSERDLILIILGIAILVLIIVAVR
jgi:pyruvate/2-oxoglutarate dehydrogenase complex dihydrolipoamide acyltransferase (E2) component